MRVTVLAVPPMIPLIHHDLRMTETQVGLLIGLPLVAWAIAAIPGSLLIARVGPTPTLIAGLGVTGLAAAGRAAATDLWLLYLMTTVMGVGIAIVQPAVPTLVREWLPRRIGLGAAVASNGILVGVALGPVLTIPLVLPLVGNSWRWGFVLWALPVLLTALLFFIFAPPIAARPGGANENASRWWPDWKNPLIWLLGLTFGSNNAIFFGANAFLPDYLTSIGRAELTGAVLGWMNGCELIASTLLLVTADYVQRRAWPYLVFGGLTFAALLGIVGAGGVWVVPAAALLGFSLAVTFVLTLALPPALSPPGEVHRVSAGMFTLSYSMALLTPIVCGALWDLTGRPEAAFLLLAACAITLTLLGLALSGQKRR